MTTHQQRPIDAATYAETERRLASLLGTERELLLLQGEAILLLEATARGVGGAGVRVLNLVSGPYGEVIGDWLGAGGALVEQLTVEFDRAIDPDAVARTLAAGQFDVLSVVHAEAATGVVNPLAEIAAAAHDAGALVLVDAVASVGAEQLLIDEWDLDLVMLGPQKALGGPAGVCALVASQSGWAQIAANPGAPRGSILSLLDWKQHWIDAGRQRLPGYAYDHEMWALIDAIAELEAEGGVDVVVARHARARAGATAGARALGLEPWVTHEHQAASVVTLLRPPPGITVESLTAAATLHLEERHRGLVAAAPGPLAETALRINHTGRLAHPHAVLAALTALANSLRTLGALPDLQAALAAAEPLLLAPGIAAQGDLVGADGEAPHSDQAELDPLAELADAVTEIPLVDGTSTRFVNFDYAASAPPLASVHRIVTTTLAHYASIHRGQSYLSRISTAAYEQARETIAELTGAAADQVVVFTRNTTDALNLLARATPGRVLHLDIEHHANLLPWRAGLWATVLAQPTLAATLEALEIEISREPAALVAVTGASNVTGECPPLAVIAKIAHRHGARLAVDGAQLAPHRELRLADTGIDYLACSGHKLYAPYGGGALIGRRDWLDAAEPHQAGGGAVLSVTIDDVRWKSSPARHEGGTPNLVGAVSLGAAFQALHRIGFDSIREHEQVLHRQLLHGLDQLGLEPLRLWPDHDDQVGVASFNVPGYRADLVAAYLSAEYGIGVRGGKFCAHPLLERFGLGDVGAVRASIGLGTSTDDVRAILAALAKLLRDGPRWRYQSVHGYISPTPDPRPQLATILATAGPRP